MRPMEPQMQMNADKIKNKKHWNHRWTQMNTDNSNPGT